MSELNWISIKKNWNNDFSVIIPFFFIKHDRSPHSFSEVIAFQYLKDQRWRLYKMNIIFNTFGGFMIWSLSLFIRWSKQILVIQYAIDRRLIKCWDLLPILIRLYLKLLVCFRCVITYYSSCRFIYQWIFSEVIRLFCFAKVLVCIINLTLVADEFPNSFQQNNMD